ncbi:MAG TPA: DUF2934 domain-containing protein [Verrucomicrobiae bacterium]|nr:DUF2934 domain-containing protein [Verrucomicrobiae bacterium]
MANRVENPVMIPIGSASPEATHHLQTIIRRRAYELYEQRGRKEGHAVDDWLCAEAEILRTRLRKAKAAAAAR